MASHRTSRLAVNKRSALVQSVRLAVDYRNRVASPIQYENSFGVWTGHSIDRAPAQRNRRIGCIGLDLNRCYYADWLRGGRYIAGHAGGIRKVLAHNILALSRQ